MKKYSLNIFDLLIVALVILTIMGLNIFAAPQHTLASGGTLIRYTLELHDRSAGFYRQVEIGRTVIEGIRGFGIGTIVEVYGTPFLYDAPDEYMGVIKRVPVYGREITNVVIEAWAQITDYSTEVGAVHLRTGQEIAARSYSFAGMGFIGQIEIR